MKRKDRRVRIEVITTFKDADAILDLLKELDVETDVRFLNTLKSPKTYKRLSAEDVHTILSLKGRMNLKSIAKKIGCSATTVRAVIQGEHRLTN
ncbi:MAG: hypothetical protein KAJ55_11750 [Anaerolineales bacterium]|nr:hypothetical protein [Anaerolineales bacterium]